MYDLRNKKGIEAFRKKLLEGKPIAFPHDNGVLLCWTTTISGRRIYLISLNGKVIRNYKQFPAFTNSFRRLLPGFTIQALVAGIIGEEASNCWVQVGNQMGNHVIESIKTPVDDLTIRALGLLLTYGDSQVAGPDGKREVIKYLEKLIRSRERFNEKIAEKEKEICQTEKT